MTAALEGGEWSAACRGRTLPTGKTRYPLYRRLGGPQGRSGRAENLVPTRIRSRTLHHIVSRYIDWATGPTSTCQTLIKSLKVSWMFFWKIHEYRNLWNSIQFGGGTSWCMRTDEKTRRSCQLFSQFLCERSQLNFQTSRPLWNSSLQNLLSLYRGNVQHLARNPTSADVHFPSKY